jgi:hypothetical protein
VTAESLVSRPAHAGPAARRYLAVAVLAVAIGALHVRHRPTTVCPWRALTGIPCPFCGGTTAAADLGHGDLRAALGASPIAVGLLTLGPLISVLGAPRWWEPRHARWLTIAVVVIGSEIWQLARFGIIS